MTKAEELIKAATDYAHAISNGHSVVLQIPSWLSSNGVVRFCGSLSRIRMSCKHNGHVFLQSIIDDSVVVSYMTTYPPQVGSVKFPFEAIV